MMRSDCLARVTPPSLREGQSVRTGFFWRNLREDDVKRRFPNDSAIPLEFGYRVKFHKLYGWHKDPYKLSVNIETCTDCQCAVHLHPSPSIFKYVALLDIEVLSEMLDSEIVAVYKPEPIEKNDEGGDINPCHFNIMPGDDLGIDSFLSSLKRLEWYGFSLDLEGASYPVSDHAKNEARKAQEKHNALVVLLDEVKLEK